MADAHGVYALLDLREVDLPKRVAAAGYSEWTTTSTFQLNQVCS